MCYGFFYLVAGCCWVIELFSPVGRVVHVWCFILAFYYFSVCCRSLFDIVKEFIYCAICVFFCGSFSFAIASNFLLWPMCVRM